MGARTGGLINVREEDKIDAMRRRIESLVAESRAESVAIAFQDLATGRDLLIRPDESFHPASTIKLPIMMQLYQDAKLGRLRLDDRIPIRNSFASIVDGSPFSLSAEDDSESTLYRRIGQTETLRELNRLMITISSNFATNLLVEKLGAERITALCRKSGAPGVRVLRGVEDGKAYERGLNNAATARGLMVLLERIARGESVSRTASEQMTGVLLGQRFNDGIPAGLPPGIPVAHKTGWTSEVTHDAAIVIPPNRRPYVLVVMTRGLGEESIGNMLIAAVSRIVWEELPESDAGWE